MRKILFILFLFRNLSLQAQPPTLMLPMGHTDWVYQASFSPDSKYIVTASGDNTAKVWNAADGKLLKVLKGQSFVVHTARFSPDGKLLVTSSFDGTARIWNVEEGTEKAVLKGHTGWVMDANFSPDGRSVVTCSVDRTIKTWNAMDGKLLLDWKGHDNGINSATYSPDGKFILTASRDSIEKIWNAADGKLVTELKGHSYYVNTASYSPDGQFIVSASDDGTALVRNTAGKILLQLNGHTDRVNSAVFSADGKYIATASSDSTIKVWNAADGSMVREMTGHGDRVFYASFSPDGKYIVSASQDRTARIWNISDGSLVRQLTGHTSIVFSAAYSPDGKFMVSSSYDHTAKVWDAMDGHLIRQLTGHDDRVNFVTVSRDSRKILTASWDNTVKIWDAANGKQIAKLTGHTGRVNSALFSNDQKQIVTASDDRTVRIWNAEDGSFMKKLEACNDFVKYAAFSPDGKYIVTASLDDYTKIWDAKTGALVHHLKSREDKAMDWRATYDPTGKYIVMASGVTEPGDSDKAKIWDAGAGKLLRELKGHQGWIMSATYSPDGKQILTTSFDRSGKIWNAADGKMLATLSGHSNAVYSGQYSPDGKKIITASEDNTIKIWDAKTGNTIYTFFTIDSTDYILVLPNGNYSCTPDAAKLLNYVRGLKTISFEQLDIRYNRPDKVLQAIGNTDTALINSYRKAWQKRIKKLGIDTTAFRDGYSIPEADFTNRDRIPNEQKTGSLTLTVKGLDSTYPLDRFNFWVNEVPVFGLKGIRLSGRQINRFDTTVTVTLSQGPNRVETSVTNVNGTESYRVPVFVNYVPDKKLKEKTYFIGIGIDRFANESYNLHYSTKDIRDLAVKFRERYGDDLVIDTLFNRNVTTGNVISLKKKLLQTTENDKVIIAYSGHGLLSRDYDYYLSTYGIDFQKPEADGLPYDELENLLDSIPARKKLLLIDACHSGEVDKEEVFAINKKADSLGLSKGGVVTGGQDRQVGLKNSFELMQRLFVNVGKGTGATVISAAAGNQFALEGVGNLSNGVFTYCILEAFQHNQAMKVSELKKIVGRRVEEITRGLQKPTSRNETILSDWAVW